MEMRTVARKVAYVVFWYVIYLNLVLYIFIPVIFTQLEYQLLILMMIVTGTIDTVLRPLSERGSARDKYSILMLILFLLTPFLWILSYYENNLIISALAPFWDADIVSYAGLVIFIGGSAISIVGRMQLKSFGSGCIVIEAKHELVQSGIYSKIRHPIYLGGLIGAPAMLLVFRAVLMPLLALLVYFVVLRGRMQKEEEMLKGEFGQEYVEYMEQTSRLIPGMY
jgi:protein-S-isoprenylcysteine O-methyltransferase Ste14